MAKLYNTINKDNWTQGHSYVGATAVLATSEMAEKRCLRGWVEYTYGPNSPQLKKLEIRFHNQIAKWNGAKKRTVEEVVALCKELDI